eukprot:gene12071-14767_t
MVVTSPYKLPTYPLAALWPAARGALQHGYMNITRTPKINLAIKAL